MPQCSMVPAVISTVKGPSKPAVLKEYQTSWMLPAPSHVGAAPSLVAAVVVPCTAPVVQLPVATSANTLASVQASFAGGWAKAPSARSEATKNVLILFIGVGFGLDREWKDGGHGLCSCSGGRSGSIGSLGPSSTYDHTGMPHFSRSGPIGEHI